MLVLAKSIAGHEFMYRTSSAHQVSKASAKKIADALNKARYDLKDNEVWYIHEVDQFDSAYIYAQDQAFKVYKGSIKRIGY